LFKFKGSSGQIAQFGMSLCAIVIHFDVFEEMLLNIDQGNRA